jgi:hypothetical protein
VHSDADIVIASVCMWEARKKIIERQKEKKISITELLIYIVLSLFLLFDVDAITSIGARKRSHP